MKNEIGQSEKEYLKKINLWLLILCVLNFCSIPGVAFYYNTGVLNSLFIGALIITGPLVMFFSKRESSFTSIVMGIAFMSYSALLIHHSRGMIEMHFHIFSFIAILIMTANPWAIITAAATIAVHHISFFFLFPASIFNYKASFGIVLIHAFFVILESIPAALIAQLFHKYILAQAEIIKDLDGLSEKILTSAEAAAESGASLSLNAQDQSEELSKTASAIEEVRAKIHQSVDQLTKSQEVSTTSKKVTDHGKDLVYKMKDSIDQIDHCSLEMINQFNQLNDQLNEIVKIISEVGDKTKVINEIVFQTKLLSFNASEEAARAGEHGRGFSIVAEEVGNLAAMSGAASLEINNLLANSVSKVQKIALDSKNKIKKISDTTKNKIDIGSATANECQIALDEIMKNVEESLFMTNNINTSSNDQLSRINEISIAMKKLNEVTLLNTDSAENSAKTSIELKEQAMGIKEVVDRLLKAS
jgi:methyl-accepting chemotaxis protein